MKKKIFASLLCVAVAGLATTVAAHEKSIVQSPTPALAPLSKQQTEVMAVIETFHSAIKTGDSKLAAQVLAADVQIFEQGHRESSSAEYFGHHFKEDAAFAKDVASTTIAKDVRVMGDMALVMAESAAEGTYKDKGVKIASLATYVLTKRQGQWKVMHIHWSSRKRN
jgi:ketosteroid isomerase-like protein